MPPGTTSWSSGLIWLRLQAHNPAAAVGALPDIFLPFARDPGHSALCLDFDGTLSGIVGDPWARPPGRGPRALGTPRGPLHAGRGDLGTARRLSPPGPGVSGRCPPDRALRVGSRGTRRHPVAVGDRRGGRAGAGGGADRRLRGAQGPDRDAALAPRTGGRALGDRLRGPDGACTGGAGAAGAVSVEVRPPLDVDKGTVVRSLVVGTTRWRCSGTTWAISRRSMPAAGLRTQGVAVARVAVVDEESDPDVAEQADLVVEGPAGAVALLEQLATAAAGGVDA